MLVLSRNFGQKITITLEDGRSIEIVVVDIDRGKIRLGIDAPKTIKIHRSELLEEEIREAATPQGPRSAVPETP